MTVELPWKTWSPGDLITSVELNNLRDDIGYLLNRPAQVIVRDNGANYASAAVANTWADIDGTNLKITLANKGSLVYVFLIGVISMPTAGNVADFDFTLNGTRIGNAGLNGLQGNREGTAGALMPLNVSAMVAVTPGSNVFKPQWTPQGAYIATLYSGAGSAGTDYMVTFGAIEVA